MSRIHPVFHVVKLMPVLTDPIKGRRTRPLPPLEIVGGEERYEIEEVIDSRLRYRKLEYLVRWKGYGHKENSWIVEHDLEVPDLITTFYKTNPNAPKCINALAFRRMGFRLYYQRFAHWNAAP
jgi:Chromo (CHRromatin Organisation MOdifier) domain